MTNVTLLEDQLSVDIFVSPETKDFGQPIWDLLQAGLIAGLSTSVTEAASFSCGEVTSEEFRLLIDTLERECAHLSSIREFSQHPAYLQIIGMGPRALPLILKELEESPGHWFLALREITQENPVLPEHRGSISQMAQDWLGWAKDKGLQW